MNNVIVLFGYLVSSPTVIPLVGLPKHRGINKSPVAAGRGSDYISAFED